MKTLIVVLLLSVSAFADSSCTTLYHHGQHDIVLCRVSDGQNTVFTKTELSNSGAEELTISEKLYRLLMEQDIAEEKAHAAQVEAAQYGFTVTPVGIVPGEAALPDCRAAVNKIVDEIGAIDHPRQWTFYVACSLRDWKAIEQRESVFNYGAFTSLNQRVTFINGQIFIDPLSIFGSGYTPEQVVAHELGHVMLHMPKKDRKTETACDAWADAQLRQLSLRQLAIANQAPQQTGKP